MYQFSLEKLTVYQVSLQLSEHVWDTYIQLPKSLQYHPGNQFVRSIDSIGANIAEGYGRFHYLDRNRFYYQARGSLLEAQHWNRLLRNRNLISTEVTAQIDQHVAQIERLLNGLIKRTKELSRASHH